MVKNPYVVSVIGVAALLVLALDVDIIGGYPGPRFSTGASLPIRFGWFTPGAPIERGEIAWLCFPPSVIAFTRAHKIVWPGTGCPSGAGHVCKIVAAVPGDRVVIRRDGVYINGVRFPMSQPTHLKDVQPAAQLGRSFVVASGRAMLLGWNPESVDSRYFGPFPESVITGRITPVWPAAGIFTTTNIERNTPT